MTDYKLMIPGSDKATGTMKVKSPFSEDFVAEIETGGEQHAEQALKNAHQLFKDKSSWLPVHERIGILERTKALMEKNTDDLAVSATKEGGKPMFDSRIEVARAIGGLVFCIETIKTDAGHVVPMGNAASSLNRVAFTQKEPIGVVVAVSAFNHPLNLIVHQVAAAIAAGCPVIVKPANDTPISCIKFVEFLHAAGLPKEWCQVLIPENRTVSEKLVTDARVAFFSFIGSAKVGWALRSKLAPGTRCALEHGGVAPVILADDADEEAALKALLKGGFYHAGQVCVSVQRVYVPKQNARKFAEALAKQAAKLKVGNPLLEDTEVGPLIRAAEVTRVKEWIEEAISAGAECLTGGKQVDEYYIQPTVLYNPPAHAKVSQHEVFGPVVCIYSYDSIDEAISAANALPVVFQAGVFTKNIDTAFKVFKGLDASAVMLNDHTAFRVDDMPFAGLRESGLGVGGIPHTIKDMQIEKMMVINSAAL